MTQMSRSDRQPDRGMTAGLCFLLGAVVGAAIMKLKEMLLAEPPIRVTNTALDMRLGPHHASWTQDRGEWAPNSGQVRQAFVLKVSTSGGHPCEAGTATGKWVDILYGTNTVTLKKTGLQTRVVSDLPLTAWGRSLGHPGEAGDFIKRIEVRHDQGGPADWSCEFTSDDQLDSIDIEH